MSRFQRAVAAIALVVGSSIAGSAVGCAALKGAFHDPDTGRLIDECAYKARNAARDDGATPEEAVRVFDQCIAEGTKDSGK
jgi:hypothetical protein